MRAGTEFSASQEALEAGYARLRLIGLIVLLVLCALCFRLWQLQVGDGARFRDLSEKNRLRLKRISPVRGLMLDRTGRIVVENRPSFDVIVVPEDLMNRPTTVQTLVDAVPHIARVWDGEAADLPRGSPLEGVVAARDVAWQTVVNIEARQLDLPGVTVEARPKRFYPAGTTAAHLLGYVGEVDATELASFAGYRQGDLVGKRGLEKSWEQALRGLAGGRQVEVDAIGRELRVLDEVKAQPGYSLRLTLDLELQRRAEQALGDVEGTVVVLEVGTGEVLALLSRPAFDPNLFSRGIAPHQWRSLLNDPLRPLTNRALQGQYPPGSTLKPIMALAALEEAVITPDTSFNCSGGLTLGGRTFRCWRRTGHGALDLKQAIAQSCDVYFYRLAQRLSVQTLAAYAHRFWLGRELGLSLHASSGIFPDPEWKRRHFDKPWYIGETLHAVIGQGYVLTTPLQMAVATAALANGGTVYRPSFVKDVVDLDGQTVQSHAPEVLTRVDLTPEHLRVVQDAMREVVSGERGTGRASKLADIGVAGKTGTSQVVSGRLDQTGDMPRHHRDHAWFIAFAPFDRPEIAVVCLVEHAGAGGGTVAAPVVRHVLDAYFQITRQRDPDYADNRPTPD